MAVTPVKDVPWVRQGAFSPTLLLLALVWAGVLVCRPCPALAREAGPVVLADLVDEALRNNPEILAARARITTSRHKVPQATSLPDPMFMVGYQNEGFEKLTYNQMQNSQAMFSASQMFPYPGKRGLKGDMAAKDMENAAIMLQAARLKTVVRVTELYWDLFMAYKGLDLIGDRTLLFSRIEDAALARYSSGMGTQQEAVMAQTEKYMLREKAEMLRQKAESLEAMLNAALGRSVHVAIGRPAAPSDQPYGHTLGELLDAARAQSPEARSREKMIEQAEVKVEMARKEFYPDFTVGANYFNRGNTSQFPEMWSLTTQVNIPLYFQTKQEEGVREARSSLTEARQELVAVRNMVEAAIRDNYSMVRSSERLIDLYRSGLIPKNQQDVQLSVAGYATGKVEAITVISRLKAMLDYETSYWGQLVERAKAIVRMEALAGMTELAAESGRQSMLGPEAEATGGDAQ